MGTLRRYWWVLLLGVVVGFPVSLYVYVGVTARLAYNRYESERLWLEGTLSQQGGPRGGEQNEGVTLYRVVGLKQADDVFLTWPPQRYTFDAPKAALAMRPARGLPWWDVWYVDPGDVPWFDFGRMSPDKAARTIRASDTEWVEPPYHAGFTVPMSRR